MAAITLNMPVEVIEEIVQYTSTVDQLALCITSKLLNGVAIRYLYRSISLRTPSQLLQCCSTLKRHPFAASATRHLFIFLPNNINPTFPRAFYQVIDGALASVVGLRSFRIALTTTHPTRILDKCLFPKLRKFEFSIPTTRSRVVGSFLSRHPKLEELRLLSPYEIYDPNDFPPVPLSSLTFFVGPASLVHNLLSHSPVQAVEIWWVTWESDHAGVIASLGSKPIRIINTITFEWSLPLVHAISRYCPAITSLGISNEQFPDGVATQNFLLALNDILPSFVNLQALSLEHSYRPGRYIKMAEFDVELETVLNWGRVCPKLVVCALPSGTAWYCIGNSAWFPLDSQGRPCKKWITRLLRSRKYSTVDIRKELDRIKEAVDALDSTLHPSSRFSNRDIDEE